MALQSKEEKLSFRKQVELKIHLFYCRCCSNFVKQDKLMDKSLEHYMDSIGQAPPFAAPNDLKEKLRSQLR